MWDSGSTASRTRKQKLLQGLHPRGFKTGNLVMWLKEELESHGGGEVTHKLTQQEPASLVGRRDTRVRPGLGHQAEWHPGGCHKKLECEKSALLLRSRRSPRQGSPRESIPRDPGQSRRRGRRVLRAKKPETVPPFPQTSWCRPRHLVF